MDVDFKSHAQPQNLGPEKPSTSTVTQGQGDIERQVQLTRQAGLTKHLQVDISTQRADVLLLTCCLISGLTDSTIYDGTRSNLCSSQRILIALCKLTISQQQRTALLYQCKPVSNEG